MAIKHRGFTLIELLVVIAIISILASIIIVNMNSAREKSRDTKRQADLRTVQTALENYYYKNQSYVTGTFFSPYNLSCSSLNQWRCPDVSPLPPNPHAEFRDALVGNNFLADLPVDPRNRFSSPSGGTFLSKTSGITTYDINTIALGYLYYSSDGKGYILGTNLEQVALVSSKCGNYQLVGGDQQNCTL